MSALELHRDAVVVDAHNDLPLMLLLWHRSLGPQGIADYFREAWLPEARAGGVDVQVCPVYVDPARAEGSLRFTLLALEALQREAAKTPDEVAVVRSGAELDAALAAGKVALLLALEGAPAVGEDVEMLGVLHRLGVRMVSLTHWGRTPLAEGSGDDDGGGRLSAAGVAAVTELERLGIIVDVSHLGLRSLEHVLELATRPLVASHSSARALRDHHRNLGDEHLRAIAATGGVVGVNFLPDFIAERGATIDGVVDHLEHVASVAGIDHVGIGPDFVKDYFDTAYPQFPVLEYKGADLKEAIPGLAGTRDLPRLTERMVERGWAEADVRKALGENFLRVFRELR